MGQGKSIAVEKRRRWHQKLRLAGCSAIAILPIAMSGGATFAQIAPDGTLSTTVTAPDGRSFTINGGTQAGNNLFHSFREFSIPTDSSASFNNAANIQNIFSRVTGGSISSIDGSIKANGSANLFLINPSGIIFGPNASLNIGGSFIASTADSVVFGNGIEFSAVNSSASPLLAIGVPLGLQYGSNPGAIANRSQANSNNQLNTVGLPVGLAVQPGRTLALVGGDVTLEGGNLSAFGGRIEIGSVAGSGFVSLSAIAQGWQLGYEGVKSFGNISVLPRNDGGREIASVVDASGFFFPPSPSGNAGSPLPNVMGGSTPPGATPVPEPVLAKPDDGSGGEIQLRSHNLTVTNSGITSSTKGQNPNATVTGGNISAIATGAIEVSGTVESPLYPYPIPAGLLAQIEGFGTGGNLNLTANQLIVQGGANISTDAMGSAQSGDLNITARDSITLRGTPPGPTSAPTGLLAQTQGKGNGGNITVDTGRLTVENAAQVAASTAGPGNAGNILIRASESVNLSGGEISPEGGFASSGIFSQAILDKQQNGTFPEEVGKGGNVSIETRQLNLRDRATITVSAQRAPGTPDTLKIGDAGNLQIDANNVLMNNGGLILARSPSGNGGNIAMNTDTIVGFNNSDISADANGGAGGVINITTQAAFGFQVTPREEVPLNQQGRFDPTLISTSDITAFSATDPSLDGQVTLNILDPNRSQGAFRAPGNPINPDSLIAQGCEAGAQTAASWYREIGGGGARPNPGDRFSGTVLWEGSGSANPSNSAASPLPPSVGAAAGQRQIVEAQGWAWKPGSNNTVVTLTAKPARVTPYSSLQTPIRCNGK
ncbi:MAG: filamentous hemagglutinin N-terminal domain-containing protein [Actinomycetota bacterium]